jgi:hypothetical protein
MKTGEDLLSLTPKGIEELHGGASKLDAIAKNILSLIEHGSISAETILQRSKSRRDEVIDALRLLLRNGFVATAASNRATSQPGSAGAQLNLKLGVSLSQARFALVNFCLDQFGTDGQHLADLVDVCSDVASLQQVLKAIRIEVDNRCPGRLPALAACVREINETDF